MSSPAEQAQQPNFATYNLEDPTPRFEYGIADELIPEMAAATGFTQIAPHPTEATLRAFIGHIGPAKTLQDNIQIVTERLQLPGNTTAAQVAADWLDRSGVMQPMERSFVAPADIIQPPESYNEGLIMGGVLRWMDRRADEALELAAQGKLNRVHVVAGSRRMGAEGAWAKAYAKKNDKAPTEAQFAEKVIVPKLESAGVETIFTPVDSKVGVEVAAAAASKLDTTKSIVVVGNAPSVVQTAGEFRLAAREINSSFDATGEQLFMRADGRLLAREGEPAATHQNPLTALGAVARNALLLYLNRRHQ